MIMFNCFFYKSRNLDREIIHLDIDLIHITIHMVVFEWWIQPHYTDGIEHYSLLLLDDNIRQFYQFET